jgi:cholesterol transport system auxiliary component
MTTLMKYVLMASMTVFLLSCAFGGGKPAIMLEQYALEYPPPSLPDLNRIEEVIRVERFSVAQIFNNAKIVYREKSYNYDDYTYHRWRANPGDMVSDYLLRDLRQSGLFKSVFSYRDLDDIPLVLKGGVGEFFEADEKGGRKAILSVDLTLMDLSQKDTVSRVIFQKNYRFEESVVEQTVPGFVQAMSKAMEKLSRQAIGDVYSAIKNTKR